MFRRTDKFLKTAGVVQSRLKYEDTLIAGFSFGLWWKYSPRPSANMDHLIDFLSKVGTSTDALTELPNDRERLDFLSERLEGERSGLQHWFKLGLFIFGNTWILGTDRFAHDTESARKILREDDEVRKSSSNLLTTLMDIGWPPDKAENFYVEKIVPFLYDPGHRKWIDNPGMAVMSDLRHCAKQLDSQISQDSDTSRIAGAVKALVSELPAVGKALEILLFGSKK